MSKKTRYGQCKLCGHYASLIDGHVIPKLSYERVVSDEYESGTFFNLTDRIFNNLQVTRYWFCSICEAILSKSEKFFADWYDIILPSNNQELRPTSFDSRLQDFCVSISFRIALLSLEDEELVHHENLMDAMNTWQQFLKKKTPSVAGYSQHLIATTDVSEQELHRSLMGGTYPDHHCITARIGPIHIVGLLKNETPNREIKRFWERTKVEESGLIAPVYYAGSKVHQLASSAGAAYRAQGWRK